jgi:hypothetical protein
METGGIGAGMNPPLRPTTSGQCRFGCFWTWSWCVVREVYAVGCLPGCEERPESFRSPSLRGHAAAGTMWARDDRRAIISRYMHEGIAHMWRRSRRIILALGLLITLFAQSANVPGLGHLLGARAAGSTSLTLNPTSGPPGTPVTVSADAGTFAANSLMSYKFTDSHGNITFLSGPTQRAMGRSRNSSSRSHRALRLAPGPLPPPTLEPIQYPGPSPSSGSRI